MERSAEMIVKASDPAEDCAREGVPDGRPFRVVTEDIPFNVTLSIERRPLRFLGNAYDITRVRAACDKALKDIERNHKDPCLSHTVVVHAPPEDEQ